MESDYEEKVVVCQYNSLAKSHLTSGNLQIAGDLTLGINKEIKCRV